MAVGKLKGRHLLVTGAASGMGLAIAHLFASEGAALALLDLDGAGARAAADPLGASGLGCDVSDRAAVNAAVVNAAETLGGLDGIVNAAGILTIKPFGELEPESWDRMIAVNLTGPFNVVRAALPFLRAAERATIVNIASTSANGRDGRLLGEQSRAGNVHQMPRVRSRTGDTGQFDLPRGDPHRNDPLPVGACRPCRAGSRTGGAQATWPARRRRAGCVVLFMRRLRVHHRDRIARRRGFFLALNGLPRRRQSV
jgi:nucleoside-diphosphate-sugar epimerase